VFTVSDQPTPRAPRSTIRGCCTLIAIEAAARYGGDIGSVSAPFTTEVIRRAQADGACIATLANIYCRPRYDKEGR
jgi:hypothetical protein